MLKGILKLKICSLCLDTKCDVDFEVVEVIKEILEIAWPKLNLEEGDKHLICNSCSVKLFAAFDFKSVCTDTEDTIFPYVNSQETPLVDLREIYLKEKGDTKSIDILENQKICRLCFHSVGYGFISLNEVDADIIDNYIPEVNFNATKDPVICNVCSDSLVTHGTFLSICLAAQEENRKVCGDPAEDRECCIKNEEIKIEEDAESYPPLRLENVEMIKNFDGIFSSENKSVNNKKHSPGKVQTYTCNRCDFKTMYKGNLKVHCLKHKVSLTPTYISPKSQCKSESRDSLLPCTLKDQMRVYQCEKCPYRTPIREVFISHWWTHKVPSDVKVYQCEICHYRVTREDRFRRHQLRHEDSADTVGNFKGRCNSKNIPVKKRKVTYTCNRCDFKTMYKCSLKRHCWKHVPLTTTYISKSRDASSPCSLRNQVRMYQCEKCPYRTHLRKAFISHWLTHEVPSEVKVYQCEKCHYRVTQKNNFHSHQLSHEQGGKVQIYACDKCDFQTRYKSSLFRHQLKHKTKKWKDVKCYAGDDGQLMYKCNGCQYETKNRRQLLVHRCHQVSPTKKQKFKCPMCEYESDNKNELTKHQEKHGSENKIFKCDVCLYQTIWRPSIIRHLLRHKNISEVKTYDCCKCSYRTKYKDKLKRHELRHSTLE